MSVDSNVAPVNRDLEDVFGIENACRLTIDPSAGSEDLSVGGSCDVRVTDKKMSVDGVAYFSREREEGEVVVVERCHVCCLLKGDDLGRR